MKFERHIKMKIHNQLKNTSNLKESNTHGNKKKSKIEHQKATHKFMKNHHKKKTKNPSQVRNYNKRNTK